MRKARVGLLLLATQHFAIADGDVTAAVADLAHLLGIELQAY